MTEHQEDRQALQARAIKGVSWTMIHTMVSVPVAFVVNVLIARILGVVDYGRLAYLSSIMDIASGVAASAISMGLIQFGSKAHARGDTDQVVGLLSRSQGFRLLFEFPLIAAVVIATVRIDPALLLAAVVFGVLVPSALSGATTCLLIENKSAAAAQNAMIANLITQAAVLIAALGVGTADAVWSARLAVAAATAALALLWILPSYRTAVLRPRLPHGFPTGFWPFAIPAGAASVLASFVVSRTEVLGLTWMNQEHAAGLFALAFGLAAHLFSPAQALIGPLIPAISSLAEVSPESIRPAFERTVRGAAVIVGFLIGGALPAFTLLVPLIYGSEYQSAMPVLLALGVGSGLMVLSGPIQAFLQARLKGWRLLRINATALLVDVAGMIILIPAFGVWGAVAANLGAALTRMALLLLAELPLLPISWGRFWGLALPTWLGVASGGLSYCAGGLMTHPLVGAVVAGPLGCAFLIAGMWVFRSGLTAADRSAVTHSIPPHLRWAAKLLALTCFRRD